MMINNFKFNSYVDTIVKDLKKKGVNIVMGGSPVGEHTITLTTHFDISLPLFFSKNFGPGLYSNMIDILYDKLGTEHYYMITDDLDISTEYKRKKYPSGDEIEYIVVSVVFNFVDR